MGRSGSGWARVDGRAGDLHRGWFYFDGLRTIRAHCFLLVRTDVTDTHFYSNLNIVEFSKILTIVMELFNPTIILDVQLHHSIDLFHLPTLMHNSFIH